MSAEESNGEKRIPEGLEKALANLARVTVQRGLDPGKVLHFLMELLRWKRDVWPTLTPEQQHAVRLELARYRRRLERRLEKPRSASQ